VQINLNNFGFLGKISQFFSVSKNWKKKKKPWMMKPMNYALFYLAMLHYILFYFILFNSTYAHYVTLQMKF